MINAIATLKAIETQRLIIRPVALGDEIPLNQAVQNTLSELQQWQPWANDPSLAATKAFVQNGVFAWLSRQVVFYPMVVIHKANDCIIGATGFNHRSHPEAGIYELGYWCDKQYQGQGLTTEYVNALTQYALEALHALKVTALTHVDNQKSIAVVERLNFTREQTITQDEQPDTPAHLSTHHVYTLSAANNLPELTVTWTTHDTDETISDSIAWAKEVLSITDEQAFAESKTIVHPPWSCVTEIHTGQVNAYLKQMPPKISHEAAITKELQKHHAPVPHIIAENTDLYCYLMEDAGSSLRTTLRERFDADLLCDAINDFTRMQLSTAMHIETFFKIDVPDWRLDTLPSRYADLLNQQSLLLSDGLTPTDIEALKKKESVVTTWCEELASYGIAPSLVQCDFHDNNILLDKRTGKLTFIDLGETVISHPFFSTIGCLKQICRHHPVEPHSDTYQHIKAACLKNFSTQLNKHDLAQAFHIAKKVWHIYEALCQYRLMQACGFDEILSLQRNKLSRTLNTFVDISTDTP